MIGRDSVVSPEAGIDTVGERAVERSLRPVTMHEFVGQMRMREQLEIFIGAARSRSEPLDHVLVFGPPGLGKTTLAHIIAHEMGANLRQTSGPVLEKAGDLAAILTNLEPHDVLFVDDNLLDGAEDDICTLSAQMENDFKCKDDEWLTIDEDLDYLGMQVRQDSQYLYLFMEKYIHKCVEYWFILTTIHPSCIFQEISKCIFP